MVSSNYKRKQEDAQRISSSEELFISLKTPFWKALLQIYESKMTTEKFVYNGSVLYLLCYNYFVTKANQKDPENQAIASHLYNLIEAYCKNVIQNSTFADNTQDENDLLFYPFVVAFCPKELIKTHLTDNMINAFSNAVYDAYLPGEDIRYLYKFETNPFADIVNGELSISFLEHQVRSNYDNDLELAAPVDPNEGFQLWDNAREISEVVSKISIWYRYVVAIFTDDIQRKDFCTRCFECILYKFESTQLHDTIGKIFSQKFSEPDMASVSASNISYVFRDYAFGVFGDPDSPKAIKKAKHAVYSVIQEIIEAINPDTASAKEQEKLIPLFVTLVIEKYIHAQLISSGFDETTVSKIIERLLDFKDYIFRNINYQTLKEDTISLCKECYPETQTPSQYPNVYEKNIGDTSPLEIAQEATKVSQKVDDATNKIYRGFKAYKNEEAKIDSQISKMLASAKKLLIGDTRTALIEGKKFSAIGILKKILGTAAVFSFGPIVGVVALVVRYALKKSTTIAERKKLVLEFEEELKIIDEKIEDARGDGNRQAKYALIRTKAELEKGLARIKFGLEADERAINTAKNFANGRRTRYGSAS